MDKQSKIKFSETGDSVIIVFGTGKQSIDYTSKKDAFEAITGMAKNKKITPEEFTEFRDAILAKEELPWDGNDSTKIKVIAIGAMPGMDPFRGLSFLDFLMSGVVDDIEDHSKKETAFKMCGKSKNHGHINVFGQGLYNEPIMTKVHGLMVVDLLKKNKEITNEDAVRLTKEIEESPLPIGEEKSGSAAVN